MASLSAAGKTVLVTGANGYIGKAVAQAFQKAGYTTYGLIRSSKSAFDLERHSIIPIIGSAADAKSVLLTLQSYTKTLAIIVSTTEDRTDYLTHFNSTILLLRALAQSSSQAGVCPLVLFTSGSKDYGRGGLDGAPELAMQTEQSPIRPPPFLVARATYAVQILDEGLFDAAVLRPTNVHGHMSSWLGLFFEMAANAKKNTQPLHFETDPRTILHTLNVDDCAEAYVALAEHADRRQIAGQCFNISAGKHYETLGDIANALVKLYSLDEGVIFNPTDPALLDTLNPLIAFSQWVGSDKIRELTGWTDRRPMFIEGLAEYKAEYEKATKEEAEDIARFKLRIRSPLP